MNATMNSILTRSSIRAYTSEALTDSELSAIKQAALAAPTAMNRQERRFIFVNSKANLDALDAAIVDVIRDSGDTVVLERIMSRGGSVTYGAPLVVIICAKPAKFAGVDCGIAVENIALAAKSMGLDSVILGMPAMVFDKNPDIRTRFGIPEGYEFFIAISVGHRAMDKEPHTEDESHIVEL